MNNWQTRIMLLRNLTHITTIMTGEHDLFAKVLTTIFAILLGGNKFPKKTWV